MQIEHPAIKCVERAADYIAAQLKNDSAPSLEDIAAASGLSKFHFHRIYRLVAGETCAQTIMRLRLARGAGTLLESTTSVTQAAMAAGYGSSQAFAKAMKRALTNTATDLKNDPERLASAIQILSEPTPTADDKFMPAVRIELCSLDPFEIIVIRTTDVYPNLNDTYWQLVEAAGNPENIRAVFGIPHRDIATHEDGDFVFECALTMQTATGAMPSGIAQRTISGGQYLIVRHTGSYDRLSATLDGFYDYVLRNGEITLFDEACLFHFVDDPEDVEEEKCRTDIYVRIETDL